MNTYHPVFDRFPALDMTVPAGFQADFAGALLDPRMFDPDAAVSEAPQHVRAGPPGCSGEGYFDLIAVADAVDAARGRFVMAELGAGYGYWLSEGGGLARRKGLKPYLIGVEGDPGHFRMMQKHLAYNDYAPEDYRLLEAAVAPQDGEVFFCTGDAWGFGQAIVSSADFPAGGGRGRGQPGDRHVP